MKHNSTPNGWGFETSAYIVKGLDSISLASVLWGNRLISLYGVPTIVDVSASFFHSHVVRQNMLIADFQGVSLLVPDDRLPEAVSTLVSAGFQACYDPSCSALSPGRVSPIPPVHLHLLGESEDVIELHKHSEISWKVRNLVPFSKVGDSEDDIICASDNSLPPARVDKGCGPMPTNLYPVCIPSIYRYTEAVILLRLEYRQDIQGPFWSAMLTYIGEYIHRDGRLNCDLLPPSMQRFMQDRENGDVNLKTLLNNLEIDLEYEEATDFGTDKKVGGEVVDSGAEMHVSKASKGD